MGGGLCVGALVSEKNTVAVATRTTEEKGCEIGGRRRKRVRGAR